MSQLDAGGWDSLVERLAGGDRAAGRELVESLWPKLLMRIQKRRAIRQSPAADDHAHNVAVRVIDGLLTADLARKYLDWRAARDVRGRFLPWICTVADRAASTYMREQLGRTRSTPDVGASSVPSKKRLLNEFTSSLLEEEHGTRPPFTNIQAAKELIAFANQRLPREQLRVLELWLQGTSHDEMAAQLDLEPSDVEALRRAAVATLRRHFVGHRKAEAG